MKLGFNLVFAFYYIYCIIVLILTGYVVFILNNSGWWFVLAYLMMQITPSISYSDKEESQDQSKTN